MNNQALLVAVLLGAFLFLFILWIAALSYDRNNKKLRSGKDNPQDWLLHDLDKKFYSAFFGLKDPDEVAVSLGIDIEKYYKSCSLTRTKPDTKKLIANHIFGILALLVSIVLGILISPLFIVVGVVLFFVLVFYEQNRLNKKAEEMRIQIENEMPRFLDMLQTELQVGLPVETAIYILCERFPGLLSREFQEALNESELGMGGWQIALDSVAEKYDIDTLSDFVLNVSTAYTKGVSIADTVTRKAKDIKQTYLLGMKERAGKSTNTILLPMVVFQFVPLIAFLMIPSAIQLFSTSGGISLL